MEGHSLRGFENGVQKKMIGPKMEEVIRVLIKLRIGELNDLQFSLYIVKSDEWKRGECAGDVETVGRNIYRNVMWENVKERSHLLNKYEVEGGMYSPG
jgi:hypothetical protein